MKKLNITKIFLAVLAVAVFGISCADLAVENTNDPDREKALSNDADLVSLLEGSTSDVFFYTTIYYGVNIDMYADVTSTTNMVNSWWVFADEPRRAMPNETTFDDLVINSAFWSTFNSGVQTANTILALIRTDGKTLTIDGEDVTSEMEAKALFLRGLSKAYVGMMYDQGYNIDETTDLSTLELVGYGDILEAGITDITDAVALANSISGFVYDPWPTTDSFNAAEFSTMAHGFAARALAAKARTSAEADAMDWNRVIALAQEAPGGANADAAMDGIILTTLGYYEYYNNLMDWEGYRVGTSGYLPPDIKNQHVLDTDYPTAYPTAAGVFLEESDWNPTDPRAAYYEFSATRFAQSADRNKANFTSHNWLRTNDPGNEWGVDGYPYIFYIAAETDYILAEAYLRNSNKIQAASTLNNSPYGSGQTTFSPDLPRVTSGDLASNGLSGGNNILPTATDAEFQWALLGEYTVEIGQLGGVGNSWFFMRRWDMLQAGTPTQFPIPANELEITGRATYTFGGVANAGEPGTASGANSWTELADKLPSAKSVNNRPVVRVNTSEASPASSGGDKKGIKQ